jgi:hypothetical protein
MTGRRRLGPGRRAGGQSLVEFALVAPIFFLLVFAVIQLGLIFAAHNGLVDGVRSAARRAATYRINEQSFDGSIWSSICGSIEQELVDRLGGQQGQELVVGFNRANLGGTIAYEWEQNPEGDYFLVAHISATYGNPLYVPLIGYFLDGTDGASDDKLTLTASEQMRVENPALDTPVISPPACPPL